jgi:hypothetical protein
LRCKDTSFFSLQQLFAWIFYPYSGFFYNFIGTPL